MPQVKKSDIDRKLKVLNEELEKLQKNQKLKIISEFRFEYSVPANNRLVLFSNKNENFKGQQQISYGTRGEIYKYITVIFEAIRAINNI